VADSQTTPGRAATPAGQEYANGHSKRAYESSVAAQDLTARASGSNQSNAKAAEAHRTAAEHHDIAANAHRAAGNTIGAKHHAGIAQVHRDSFKAHAREAKTATLSLADQAGDDLASRTQVK
jgi:hypothetical protein